MASDLLAIGPSAAPGLPVERPAPTPSVAPVEGLATFRIETWGCQMNEHDSEKMEGALRSIGLVPAASAASADVVLLNTCSIREKAAQKVFDRLGRLRRYKSARPHMVLAVCGCVAQQEQERIFSRAPYVDIVLGPRRISVLPDLIRQVRQRERALEVFDPGESSAPETGPVHRLSRTRAYITVMEGCNKNCTFCIVPFTRGREVCRSAASILAEAAGCIAAGLTEIELLGQNVNAWRHAGGGARPWDFARLLGAVADLPGIRRLRFTTSHPLHFRDPIIDVMASRPTIARHLHLPVQSGSDTVLKRMRRGHTRAEYLARVARLRRSVPDIALSTDLIVGFPSETERDFDQTLSLVREVGYDSIFSFVYSPRPGTPAADLRDDVDPQAKKERLYRLQELQSEIQIRANRAWVGRQVDVLIDGPAARGRGRVSGRTSQNHVVNLDGDPSQVGRMLRVRITHAGQHSLSGVLESSLTSAEYRNIDDTGTYAGSAAGPPGGDMGAETRPK